MALTQSLTSGSTIHAVDLDSKALGTIPDEDHGVVIRKALADLRSPGLRLPSVDGILMVNSLHFIQDQHLLFEEWSGLWRRSGTLSINQGRHAVVGKLAASCSCRNMELFFS
jgi:hypothetical protein